jgi:hypothetical protein
MPDLEDIRGLNAYKVSRFCSRFQLIELRDMRDPPIRPAAENAEVSKVRLPAIELLIWRFSF